MTDADKRDSKSVADAQYLVLPPEEEPVDPVDPVDSNNSTAPGEGGSGTAPTNETGDGTGNGTANGTEPSNNGTVEPGEPEGEVCSD